MLLLLLLFCCTLAFLVVAADCLFDISCRCCWLFGILPLLMTALNFLLLLLTLAGWHLLSLPLTAWHFLLRSLLLTGCHFCRCLLLTVWHFLLLPLTDVCFLPLLTTHQKGKFRIPKHAGPKTQTGNITTQHHILKPVSVFLYPYLVSPQTLLQMLQNTNQQNPKQRF